MTVNIELPHVGESVTEAIIGKWLRAPGDRIEKYDPIVEVITDKVTMEVPAPESGTLTRLLVEEGDTVAMGAVIAEMDAEGTVESVAQEEVERRPLTTPSRAPQTPAGQLRSRPHTLSAPAAERVGTLVTGANVGPTGGTFSDTSLLTSAPPPAGTQSSSQAPARGFSPVVTRLAAQHGIDPATLTGTGLDGRVTKNDVLRAVEQHEAEGPGREVGVHPADRIIQPAPVRKMIAAHMSQSFREIPHAWSAIEVDVTGLVEARAAGRDRVKEEHGVNLTYLPFTLSAVARALRSNLLLNSTWQNGEIILKSAINVGIAVAGNDGLVVPVIATADSKSILQLAVELDSLVRSAREGSLTIVQVQGGTFTLNNTGALGSVWGGAIINYPQAAILTTEAIVKRPVVVSGQSEDAIVVRSMMNICLSFDHRIVDGAEGAAFLQDVRTRLEDIGPGAPIE
jgi:2-oxoisovalerate dehydrogenase E2 component (dihydrolipoyl transacylase)